MIAKFGWDKNVRCAVLDHVQKPFKVEKSDSFTSKLPKDCMVDEAISGHNILATKIDKGLRKALLKNAITYLKDLDGMALYVLEAGRPKNFYSWGNLTFLPASLPEAGMFMTGNKVYTFDPEQIFSKVYQISSTAERDIIYSPIMTAGRQLGMLIGESAKGRQLGFKCCNCCNGLDEENRVSILLHYFSQVSATYSNFMRGLFDRTEVFNHAAYDFEIEPSIYRWLQKISAKKRELATAETPEAAARLAADLKTAGFALVYLDLNNFKKINDTYGHNAGDEALKMAADVIVNCTKSSLIEWVSGPLPDINAIKNPDLVVRWGGDEFLVVLRDADIEGAAAAGRRIIRALAKTSYKSIRLGASIGIMDSEQLQNRINEKKDLGLLDGPDDLMYKAKQTAASKADGALARMMPDGSVKIEVLRGETEIDTTRIETSAEQSRGS